MKYAMGIDLGTSGVKVGIYDEKGKSVVACTEEYPLLQPQNGYAEQNPAEWWEATVKAIKQVLISTKDEKAELVGIGLSGQMHGLVMLDEKNEVIRPAILWCDGRTGEESVAIDRLVGSERLLQITANPAIASFTAAKILWVKKHEPQNYEKTRHILLPKDYIRFMLCGVFATEVSDASGTQLLDIKNRCWSDEILSILEVDKSLLPKMYESADVTGYITEEAAGETGLKAGLLVAGGGGDNAAAAVGTGVVEDGKAFTTIGTSGVLFAHTSQMKLDPKGRVHTFCCAVRNEWHVMGVTQAAGLSMQWLRNNLCMDEVREAEQIGVDDYVYLDQLAEKAPIGANRLIYLPYLMGERTPHLDPNARGAFIGLSAIHKKADIIRAVLEGVSYSLMDCFEILREMGAPPTDMAICGGGAKSPLWRRMLTDVYGCNIKLLQSNEGACLGAAILAFCAAGVFESVQAACKAIISAKETLTPETVSHDKYARVYNIYRGLYKKLKLCYAELAEL